MSRFFGNPLALPTMTTDWLYVALIVLALAADNYLLWPSFERRLLQDPSAARSWLWRRWVLLLWLLAIVGALAWVVGGRSPATLGLGVPVGWQLAMAILPIVALVGLQANSARAITRLKGPKDTLRSRLGPLEKVMPHTQAELAWFTGVSLTAGICEELVFRGYLLGILQPHLGEWGAAAVSLVLFAAGHIYQGRTGIVRSAVLGAAITAFVVLTGSLWPAIVLHVLLDATGGLIGWLILREAKAAAA